MEPAVLYERTGHVGILVLNRPDNRNSMTPELLESFERAIAEARRDVDSRCLVLTGRGACFSAGADFKSGLARASAGTPRKPHEMSYAMYAPFLGVLEVEVPVVAALNGHAVGGGFGLALLADLRIAASGAKYGANFARLGLHSGLGISYLLPRLVGLARASELLYTGRLVVGDEALAMGLVNAAVRDDEVLPHAMTLAESIASNAPYAVRTMKRTMRKFLAWDVKAAAWEEAYAQAASLQTNDAVEGMAALLEKRAPEFTGT
jgi:enoyl-CoA hydratase/carnithine racemase